MDIPVANDVNAILTPTSERVGLENTIDIIESLSVNAQKELLDIAATIRATDPLYLVVFNEYISELLNSGIIIDSDPQKHGIMFGKKSEITKFLDKENIPYDKKAKKCELEKICIEHAPEKASEQFGKSIYASIPTKYSRQKIHWYLHRKYDSESYYDEHLNFFKVQLLDTDLPDDDVTNQLIKRGYYSRK